MIFRSKIKWAALGGLFLSIVSLVVHLILAKYSTADLVQYGLTVGGFSTDLGFSVSGTPVLGYRKLWANVKLLQSLQPYSSPKTDFPEPSARSNGFIYAKIFGGFEKIRNSIPDLVAIARLLNATLVIPEIQESLNSKGIRFTCFLVRKKNRQAQIHKLYLHDEYFFVACHSSSKFSCFSYLYNEEQFITALKNDVIIVRTLPPKLKEARKQKQFPTFKPVRSASPSYYTSEVLPVLKRAKVVGLVINDGGCLQGTLPPSLTDYQRLRCRVAYHALHFRAEVLALGHEIVKRLMHFCMEKQKTPKK